MTNFEMVEVLREKASVSYEEAKAALEKSGWDLLDAMLLLEQEGKVPPQSCSYSTREETRAQDEQPAGHRGPEGLRGVIRYLGKMLRKLIVIGNNNSLVISRRDEEIFSLPITVCVLLLICSISTVLVVMAVSLFFGVRYSFRGPNLGNDTLNGAMDKAAQAVENIKEEMQRPSGEE